MKAILAILAVLGIDLSSKEWAEKNLPLNKKREIVKVSPPFLAHKEQRHSI